MGHIVGKKIYRKLGRKIDGLNVNVPWNETLYEILKELYPAREAELVVRMPSGLAKLEEIQACAKMETRPLRILLDRLCGKGLVVDVFLNNDYYYCPSPLIIGIFEFTMMRTDKHLDVKKIARLFHQYFSDGKFLAANFKGKSMGLMRTVPYEESFEPGALEGDYVEVLDYEKATAIVEAADTFSIGLCSCRHEMLHAGEKPCDVPLDTCSSLGYSAEYLIRNNLARKVSKSEMLDNVARSKELGLVLNADNVQNNPQFICHCCKCCCHVLLGVSRFGYPNIVVTSSFIAEVDGEKCTGCGSCAKACGVEAIEIGQPDNKIKIDKKICIGCGVCVVKCNNKALELVKRKQRVLHPETTFEKVILKHLEKGTLQDQLFVNPGNMGQKVLRGLLAGFLRLPPVKRTLMSDLLRSRFLNLLKKEARRQGKSWATNL
jgi:ferredoxin